MTEKGWIIINSNDALDRYLNEKFSTKLELASPLFYNAEVGIRFEIGIPDPSVSDEEYQEQVNYRALTLFKDVHHDDDEMLIALNYDLKRAPKPKKIKAFDHALMNQQIIRSLSCKNIHKYDDQDDGWESYRLVLKCRCSDLKYRKILFSPYDLYFVNTSRNTIFHFYDSRGLDVVSNSKEVLKELYLKRNKWILNYDRERIDSIFK